MTVMPVTTKQIVRGLRAELSLTNPDFRAAGRMIAAALELLNARAEALEKDVLGEAGEVVCLGIGPSPGVRHAAEPEIRQADPPPARARGEKAKRR